MSQFEAKATLNDTTQRVMVPLPKGPRYILVASIFGTFVGTIKIQTSDDGLTWTDASPVQVASSGATIANPTGVGNFAALLGASAVAGRVVFSAYTSGSATVDVQLIPYSV